MHAPQEIKRILVDEMIPSAIVEKIKDNFGKNNIEVKWINTDVEELRGRNDKEIIEWIKKNNFDAIVTSDHGMAKIAIENHVKLFFIFIYEKHKKFVLTKITPIIGWEIKIETIKFNQNT